MISFIPRHDKNLSLIKIKIAENVAEAFSYKAYAEKSVINV